MFPVFGSTTTWTTSSPPVKNPTSQSPVPSLRLAEGSRFGCSFSAAIALGSCLAISVARDWLIGGLSACAGAAKSQADATTKARATRPGFAFRRERMRSLVVEGPQLVADEVERHREGHRDGLGRKLAHTASDEELERNQVDHQGEHAHHEEAGRLEAGMAVLRIE